ARSGCAKTSSVSPLADSKRRRAGWHPGRMPPRRERSRHLCRARRPRNRPRPGGWLMEVTFYGVRGSIPAPGPETNRYGGNTSCVAVRSAAGALVILDAGTGIVQLGKLMMDGEFGAGRGEATILLSHAHWDHIQGFPFFAPVLVPGNRFAI